MAVIDAKLVPVLIEKLQTELDEIKVISNWLTVVGCWQHAFMLIINSGYLYKYQICVNF